MRKLIALVALALPFVIVPPAHAAVDVNEIQPLNDFEVSIPLLALLDKDPATLTAAEAARIQNAEQQRVVQLLVAVHYAGAIHRLSITLKFD